MGKTDIRNRFIEVRGDITRREYAEWNADIKQSLSATLDWQNIRRMHAYRSVAAWNEADTSWLPTFTSATWPAIELIMGDPNRSLPIPDQPFDLIVVPLLAFDDRLNRLGFGGGWYDRFLVKHPDALKVGIAYDAQQADALPVRPHDIALDMIVTQSRVITK